LRDLQTAERTKAVDSIASTTYWKNDIPPEASAAYGKEISRLWLERDRIMRSIFPEEQEAFALNMQARFGPISEATKLKIAALEVTRTLDLAASKATEVYEVQRQLQKRQMEIRAATASNPADRQAQLTALTAETNYKLATILTPAGLEQFNKGQRGGGIIFM